LSAAAAAPGPEQGRQHYNVTLGVLLTGALAYALSQTMIAPAIPEIQSDLGTTTTLVTFALTAFLLAASVATPIMGRLGDMFGKERMLVITLIVFALGSLVCALSHSIALLIAGRVIQGVGGAIFPLSFGIIRDEFPRDKVATGIGLISATFGIGGGAGLVISGLIVDHFAYEWIFWLGLIVAIPAVIATHLFIPESPVKSPARIDWGGAGLLTGGLVALLVAVSEGDTWGWTSPTTLGVIALAIVFTLTWIGFEMRHPEPLVDMRMMRRRPVLTTNITALLVGFGMFGSFILIPQFVQVPTSSGFGFGATVTAAGLFMLPSALVMLVAGPVSGWMGGRYGSKLPLLIGTILACVSFTSLAIWHDSHLSIYVGTAFMGLGIGFAFAAMANLIVDAVDQSQTGVATGMNTIMRSIGGAIGGQVSASIIAGHVAAGGAPTESGYTLAFAVSALGLGLAVVAALAIPGRLRANAGTPAHPGPPIFDT
jgi:EmrB/QacA subfamily drug resistance transporter